MGKERDEAFTAWLASRTSTLPRNFQDCWNAAWKARGERDLAAVEAVKAEEVFGFSSESPACVVRLEESSGWGKARWGELYPRDVRPPKVGLKAIIEDGEVYWTDCFEGDE